MAERISDTLPGHEKWTYGGARGIFAESPNRVYLLGGGELPNIPRPQTRLFPEIGPNVQFPLAGLPWRNANTAAPPGARRVGPGPGEGDGDLERRVAAVSRARRRRPLGALSRRRRRAGQHHRSSGRSGTSMFKRPHAVYISPYDAQKHVWVVDDHTHAIYKFTNDGKQLVQTIGTPNVPGADGTHFNRPTFMAWLPDGSFYVSDGYNGTRVAKFDAQGKFLLDFGMRGEAGKETRPGYMNNVHGVAVDVETQARVRQRSRQPPHPDLRRERQIPLRVEDRRQSVEPPLRPDRRGSGRGDLRSQHPQDAEVRPRRPSAVRVGNRGDFPGTLWGVHGMSTDQEGNLYVAEVDAGRFQKFRPRPGANPAYLIGKPVYSAWQ